MTGWSQARSFQPMLSPKRFRLCRTEPASFSVSMGVSTAIAGGARAASGHIRWAERVSRSRLSTSTIRSTARVTNSTPTPEPVAKVFTLNSRRRLSHRRLFLRTHRLMRRIPGREMRRE